MGHCTEKAIEELHKAIADLFEAVDYMNTCFDLEQYEAEAIGLDLEEERADLMGDYDGFNQLIAHIRATGMDH